MNDPQLDRQLYPYLPDIVLNAIEDDASPTDTPLSERFSSAVMLADLSGFTRLAEQISQKEQGVESLTKILNNYFGGLITQVYRFGGDVIKFAGDALLAIWKETDKKNLEQAVLQAGACGLAIQEWLDEAQSDQSLPLRIRIAVSVGELEARYLGGVYQRFEFLITGSPLEQLAATENRADSGWVLLAKPAWQLAADSGKATGFQVDQDYFRLQHISSTFRALQRLPRRRMSPATQDTVKRYLPRAVVYRLEAKHDNWLGELRQVSTIFALLPDLRIDSTMEQCQDAMQALQKALYHFEGSINKLSIDGKGISLLAVLGLPPLAHEDDALRSIRAALAMKDVLNNLNLNCSIGIATGNVYCGAIGNDVRREYSVIGDPVNLAAKLMARADNSILCDINTYNLARDHINFSPAETLRIKGKAEPQRVYTPISNKEQTKKSKTTHSHSLIGRDQEKQIFLLALKNLFSNHSNQLIVIEGGPGFGKSHLFRDFLASVMLQNVYAFYGNGDSINQSRPLLMWLHVFRSLLGLDGLQDIQARTQRAKQQIASKHAAKLPLLNDLLAINEPENEFTSQLDDGQRIASTFEILLYILKRLTMRKPVIILLDDLHWADTNSFQFLTRALNKLNNLLIVGFTRPTIDETTSGYKQLMKRSECIQLRLQPLNYTQTVSLIESLLGVAKIPEPLADLIYKKSEGHPFFTQELTRKLYEDGSLIIGANGQCYIAEENLVVNDLPDTIKGIILSRIDSLTPDQQLTLKSASVIGRVFRFDLLKQIYPVLTDKSNLPDILSSLQKAGLIILESPAPNLKYAFSHVITQQVAYSLMLEDQRIKLHENIAKWYQGDKKGGEKKYGVLAYHYGNAKIWDKAIDALENAAKVAISTQACYETTVFIAEAQRIRQHYNISIDTAREAHWLRLIGDAKRTLGQYKDARTDLELCLKLLKQPVPKAPAIALVKALFEFIRQIFHRLFLKPGLDLKKARPDLLEAAHACRGLVLIHYIEGNPLYLLLAVLRLVNFAERADSASSILAMGYSALTALAGAVRWHKQARFYAQRALLMAGDVDQPTAWIVVLMGVGTYETGQGNWKTGEANFRHAMALAEQSNDYRRQEETMTNLATLLLSQGDFQQAEQFFYRVYESGRSRGDSQTQDWGLLGRARCSYFLSQFEDVKVLLEITEQLPEHQAESISPLSHLDLQLHKVLVAINDQQYNFALELMEGAIKSMIKLKNPSFYFLLPTCAHLVEAAMSLAENQTGKPKEKQCTKWVRQCFNFFKKYTRLFPIGQPRFELLSGNWCLITGKKEEALIKWQKSLELAQLLDMPYDEARACLTLSSQLPKDSPERQRLLGIAREYFLSIK